MNRVPPIILLWRRPQETQRSMVRRVIPRRLAALFLEIHPGFVSLSFFIVSLFVSICLYLQALYEKNPMTSSRR